MMDDPSTFMRLFKAHHPGCAVVVHVGAANKNTTIKSDGKKGDEKKER